MIAATQPALFAPVVVAPVVVDVSAELLELAELEEKPTPQMTDADWLRRGELIREYAGTLVFRLRDYARIGELARKAANG